MESEAPDNIAGMNPPRTPRRWYEKVKARMDDLGMSYAELADRLTERGIETAKSTVGSWMVGKNEPQLSTIQRIGEILGMSVSEMIGEDVYFVTNPLVRAIVERMDGMTEDDLRAVLKLLGIEPPPQEKKRP